MGVLLEAALASLIVFALLDECIGVVRAIVGGGGQGAFLVMWF